MKGSRNEFFKSPKLPQEEEEQRQPASPKETKQVTQSTREGDEKDQKKSARRESAPKDSLTFTENSMKLNVYTAAVRLSDLAELFREVEMLYMTSQNNWHPEILAEICNEMLERTFNFSCLDGQTPGAAVRIDYLYNTEQKKYVCEKKSEKVDPKKVENSLLTLVEMTKTSSPVENFANRYWLRQLEYYEHTIYKTSSTLPRTPSVVNSLVAFLTPFEPLLCHPSPKAAAISAYDILRENKQLSEQVCEELVLAVWVGRYMQDSTNNISEKIHKVIIDFATICFNLHPQIQKILAKEKSLSSSSDTTLDTMAVDDDVEMISLSSSSTSSLRSQPAMFGSGPSSSSSSYSSSSSSSLGALTSSLKTFSLTGE